MTTLSAELEKETRPQRMKDGIKVETSATGAQLNVILEFGLRVSALTGLPFNMSFVDLLIDEGWSSYTSNGDSSSPSDDSPPPLELVGAIAIHPTLHTHCFQVESITFNSDVIPQDVKIRDVIDAYIRAAKGSEEAQKAVLALVKQDVTLFRGSLGRARESSRHEEIQREREMSLPQ